jgi:hypothetical protein
MMGGIRPRFSLRLLLLAVTVFGLWLPWQMQRARQQKQAVRRLHGIWGKLTYDYEVGEGLPQTVEARIPKPLLDRLGVDFFHSVHEATTIGGWDELGKLPGLVRLSTRNDATTDADMAALANLRQLRELRVLTGRRVPATGWTTLAGLYTISPNQPAFILRGGLPYSRRLSDEALEVIAMLPRLEKLTIEGADFTAAGLAALRKSRSLQEVEIYTCDERLTSAATDAALAGNRFQSLKVVRWTEEEGEVVVAEK